MAKSARLQKLGTDWASLLMGSGIGLTLALELTTMRASDFRDVYQKIDGHYELVYSFTNIIDDNQTNSLDYTWSSRKLQTINNRVTELEQRTFQQSTTPTIGVNAGDI